MISPDDINKAFENRVRLCIMTVLIANENMDFITLKQLLNVSDGNLSSHTAVLEELGYISGFKQFINRKSNTTYSITEEGRTAFKKHIETLEKLLKYTK